MFTDPSPPSPYPPPPSPPLPDPSLTSAAAVSSGDNNPHSGTPSILIIISIIALVIAASASIHLLLRLISRFRSSSSSSSPISSPSSPSPLLRSTSSETTATDPPPPSSDREKLIASLPLFSLATSVAAFRKSSSLDCAVCLSNFRPQDELRLLPACRHAFHSQCVDTWLRSTPSCPLCRASIHLPAMPPPAVSPAVSSRSGSFRVELGSVSRRRGSENGIATPNGRSYSLGSSFEYLVEEEVEAVLERLRVAPEGKVDNGGGGEVEIVDAGGGRGWIRDCVDRLTSSASSSFNSLRFSGRIGSHRFDSGVALATAAGGGRSWDLEANNFMEWEEESGFASLYRWLVGI